MPSGSFSEEVMSLGWRAQAGGGGACRGAGCGLWWNTARGTSVPWRTLPVRGMLTTGLLAAAVGESVALVLPVIAQADWPSGEPWRRMLAGDGGVLPFPWTETAPGKPHWVVR